MVEQKVYNRIPMDDLIQIQNDVVLKVPIEKSKLKYTADMKAVREDIEKWVSGLPKGVAPEVPKV